MFMKRAINFCVMALASSTKPSSSRSCTLPRIPDSKAEATRNCQHVYLSRHHSVQEKKYSRPAYNLKQVSKVIIYRLRFGLVGEVV